MHKILFLSASLSLTGTHRVMLDLIKGLNRDRYRVFAAYKPELQGPGNDILMETEKYTEKVFKLRGKHVFAFPGIIDLNGILRNNRFDIIHCWDSLSIIARITGKLYGSRVIDSIGNPPVMESWKNRLAKKITSLFLDGAVFCSNESLKSHYLNGANIHKLCTNKVIYNCIDIDEIPEYSQELKLSLRKKYGISANDILLTNLGMYNEQKAQRYLIEALIHVLPSHPETRLFLVGWGKNETLLKNRINDLGLQNNVVLTGKKLRKEVFEILSITDIYVSSSLWEGLPLSVLEAMAFRLPVAATDVTGNSEAVENNITGFLFPEKDPLSSGNSILKLIDNPGLRLSMGLLGREKVEKDFSKKQFISGHESFYDLLTGR